MELRRHSVGYRVVRDINPGGINSHSSPEALTDVDGTLFFTAFSRGHGYEPWRSDGTRAGTTLVRDIRPTGSSRPYSFTSAGGALHFVASDGVLGSELWRSDGTELGTTLVRDINPGRASSSPERMRDVDGTRFFAADDGSHGPELWRSDGTEAGTTLVRDIFPGSGEPDSSPYGIARLTNVEGTLFFVADDGAHGFELWRSDGTEDGTSLVRDLTPGGVNSDSWLEALTEFGGALFVDTFRNSRLWRSDDRGRNGADPRPQARRRSGAPAGSRRDALLHQRRPDPRPGALVLDGTPEGTKLLRDIRPGQKSSVPYDAGFKAGPAAYRRRRDALLRRQ